MRDNTIHEIMVTFQLGKFILKITEDNLILFWRKLSLLNMCGLWHISKDLMKTI